MTADFELWLRGLFINPDRCRHPENDLGFERRHVFDSDFEWYAICRKCRREWTFSEAEVLNAKSRYNVKDLVFQRVYAG